jgi:hypothetical protein
MGTAHLQPRHDLQRRIARRFADLGKLPTVVQINAAAQIAFHVSGVGEVTNRLTVLNVLDRVNLIRPAEGIGIFQSAYGPRLTVLNTFTVPF